MKHGPIRRPIRVLSGLLDLFLLLLGGVGVVILDAPLGVGLFVAGWGGLFLVPAFRADSVTRVDTASVDRRARSWGAVGVAAPTPRGSGPGYRRPVLVVQADAFNRSRIDTVIVAVLTANIRLAEAPGNLLLEGGSAGLERPSVVNVSQLLTIDRSLLDRRVGVLDSKRLAAADDGLRLVLAI